MTPNLWTAVVTRIKETVGPADSGECVTAWQEVALKVTLLSVIAQPLLDGCICASPRTLRLICAQLNGHWVSHNGRTKQTGFWQNTPDEWHHKKPFEEMKNTSRKAARIVVSESEEDGKKEIILFLSIKTKLWYDKPHITMISVVSVHHLILMLSLSNCKKLLSSADIIIVSGKKKTNKNGCSCQSYELVSWLCSCQFHPPLSLTYKMFILRLTSPFYHYVDYAVKFHLFLLFVQSSDLFMQRKGGLIRA